jgi:hypothetical protein
MMRSGVAATAGTSQPLMSMVDALSTLLTVEGLLSATIALAFAMASDTGLRRAAAGAARTIGRIASLALALIAVAAFFAWVEVVQSDWSDGASTKVVLLGLLLGIVTLPTITFTLVYYSTRRAGSPGAQ